MHVLLDQPITYIFLHNFNSKYMSSSVQGLQQCKFSQRITYRSFPDILLTDKTVLYT